MNREDSSATGADVRPTEGNRFTRWVSRNLPTRESIEGNRVLRPIAHRVLAPELWRFTRRSVPRGVALGIVTGILIPMGQIPASAVFALPLRANIPAAALTTFLTNPATTPPLWIAAYWLGRWELGFGTVAATTVDAAAHADLGWSQWIFSEAGPSIAVGLVTITAALTVLAWAVTKIGWRLWIARKWRRRSERRAAAKG